jgi:hypothetical protein
MNFYIVVLAVAIIIFTAIMVWFAYTLNAVTSKEIFPPVTNACPDGWLADTTSTGVNKCYKTGATGNVGTSLPTLAADTTLGTAKYDKIIDSAGAVTTTVYPDSTAWTTGGVSSICGKRTWSNQYNIQWGGVSNYNGC